MMPDDAFPVLHPPAGCPTSVPWTLVAGHEAQAQYNHDQTLRRLAERGGLNPVELYLVLHDRPLREFHSIKMWEAVRYLAGLADA